MIILFKLLAFSILNMLRGADKIKRVVCAALMAMVLDFGQFSPDSIVMFALLWLGFMPGWCLALTAGNGPRDWMDKFKPAGWIIGLMGNPENIYLYGAIGTFVRSLCFIPAIVFAHSNFVPFVVLFFALGFTFSYFLGGLIARKITKLEPFNVRIGEGFSAAFLASALIVG